MFRPGFLQRTLVSFAPTWFEAFPEIYSAPYEFSEPDTEDNIICTAKEGRLANWNLGSDLDIPVIRGATLDKLVERLTYHAYFDQELLDTFLLTYGSFTTGKDLLLALIRRYHVKRERTTALPADNERWSQIQLRVLNVLKAWVKQFWMDFENNRELIVILKKFIEYKVLVLDEIAAGSQVLEAITKSEIEWTQRKEPALSGFKKATNNFPEPDHINSLLLSIDPTEFGEQLTLLQAELFYQIYADEFLNKTWKKASHGTDYSNLTRMIDSFNQTSNWIQCSILYGKKPEDRAALIKYYIKVALRLRELNNFNGLMVIVSAMESSPIHRLKKSWELVSKEKHKLFDEIKDLMSHTKSFANYRTALRTAQPPMVPYVGLYLTDLTFVGDGNEDFISRKGSNKPLINFEKRRMMARTIAEVRLFQQTKYTLESKNDLQSLVILAHGSALPFTAEILYNISLEREPRAGGLGSASSSSTEKLHRSGLSLESLPKSVLSLDKLNK